MATRCNQGVVFKKKTDVYNGHRVQYDFSMQNLVDDQPLTFSQNFETSCKVLPTSWLLRIDFHQVSDNGSISIPVTLSRKDSMVSPVNAFIWVSLADAKGEPFFDFPRIFRRDIIHSNEKLQEAIAGTLKCPELRASFNKAINVCVVIEIRYCHREYTKDPLTNLKNAKELLFSKM